MTLYERHNTLGHSITRHSPNGVDVIEECSTCGARFILKPDCAPITMYRYPPLDWNVQWEESKKGSK